MLNLSFPGGSIFSPPKPQLPPPPPPVPTPEDPEVKRRAEELRLSKRRRAGRSTILTGGLGDVSEPNVERPTLLGRTQ